MIQTAKSFLCAFVGHKRPMLVLKTYSAMNRRYGAVPATSRHFEGPHHICIRTQKIRCPRCGAISIQDTIIRS
jgi:hypothetical protein